MQHIDINEAEANFEHYVERAQRGEDFDITRGGKPVARLMAMLPRIGGLKFRFDEDASEAMDKEIEESFYASDIFPPENGPTTTAEPRRSGDLEPGKGRE